MKKRIRILISAGCVTILAIAWIITIGSASPAQKQLELISQAAVFAQDGLYVRAVPILEEAAGYNAAYTLAAEEHLKAAYLALADTRGYTRKYTNLLEKQMNRKEVSSEIYAEAANYYLGKSRTGEALKVLKAGIEKNSCQELAVLYESSRYAYETTRSTYGYVGASLGGYVQVEKDGRWGIAGIGGVPVIPCEYEKISTLSGDRAIVMSGGKVFAVDRNNNRIAILSSEAEDIGNYSENRVAVRAGGNWYRAAGDLALGSSGFEELGTYSEGYAAAKADGKWGVIDIGTKWLISPEYDGIITDELNRCYGQGSVFVISAGEVLHLRGGKQIGEAYEDARPFSSNGFAAVKRDGKWGFIDSDGSVAIEFIFDDALSFGQHLAAVKIGGLWGYISTGGRVVIDVQYVLARSFERGCAAVLTEQGWKFITLLEYKQEAGL
ncbi:MAG: WG repeat-containing protein [Oscillospiraceae bacterium]|nr:WG repeat-containing protein [Oscillospiraceae bacterium]